MVDFLIDFALVLFYTLRDILPIILLIIFFQLAVLKYSAWPRFISYGVRKSAFSCGENYGHSII